MAPVATPTPTPAALDQQAARLREQAAGLNRRQADRYEAVQADHGARFDETRRTAAEARAAANTATERADEMHGRAKEALDFARRLEADADQRTLSTDPSERETADDYREQAQLARASATSYTQRAQRSEQAARQKLDEAEAADRQSVRIQRVHDDATERLDHMRHAGNSLEDKAVLLERAADELRAADRATTPQARTEQMARAQASLARADAVKPDFSRIDPQDIVAAGIPMTEVPGAELLRPDSLDPVNPVNPVTPVNDTDLMRPDSFDPVDPVNPVNDTDLLRPDDPVDPANPLDDTDLLRPDYDPVLGPGGAGADDPGLPYPDDLSSRPGAGNGSAPASADPLGADPDPADLGDLGGGPGPVDSPAPAFGGDTYADQADLPGADTYGEAYGDVDSDLGADHLT